MDAGEKVEVFPTYTEGCYQLRDYLLKHQVNTVAMESTGVYWVILYAILEDAGLEVYLVNGRDVKNVPGRKSDVKDCQWLRQLHSYGLLRKSFIPAPEIRELRFYPGADYAGTPDAKGADPDERSVGRSDQRCDGYERESYDQCYSGWRT